MTYEEALAEASDTGLRRCSDAAAMAAYCDSLLQNVVGAASPKMVWEGARKQNLTYLQLAELAATNPNAVHDLMWL